MDQEKLKKLIAKYQASMEYYHDANNGYNETSCRDEYINPLLECFGWDVKNEAGKLPQYREVVVERTSNENERPDYTLTLNGISKMFVEAKKPSVNIGVEINPTRQIRKYGWNAKHKIGILTNFEYMLIYDTTFKPNANDSVDTALFRKYKFSEYVEKYDEIYELISKENVYNGKYDEFAESYFQNINRYKTQIDEVFLKLMNSWRLELGKYLYNEGGKYKNIDILNDTVQAFINQLIFIRICEDRELPLLAKLQEIVNDKNILQEKLSNVFNKVDKRYNSGLFKGSNPIMDVQSDIILQMIVSLYYPKSPYLFHVIEPSILGKIYEMFLTEQLKISSDNSDIVLEKKGEYIYKSVVSTPTEVVKYMVKKTLTEICMNRTPKEVLDLRIADIACGSGVFLEEAYQFLIDNVLEWYEKNEPSHLIELSNGRKKLPLKEKKDILTNCIYGVDIDIHAVEVSKFSMLLKLLEDENEATVCEELPILPDLSKNILHGNSLVERSDLPSQCTLDQVLDIAPFEWGKIEKFDAILGNPPYVKTEDMIALSGNIEFSIYKKKYKSAFKQFDKYFLFVERALSLLKKEGMLCYIIPNKFYKIPAGQELRRLVCKKVSSLDDFGALQLFPDKTIYSSIINIYNGEISAFKYSNVESLASIWNGQEIMNIELSNDKLTQEPWALTSNIEYMNLLERLERNSKPLGDVCRIFNGIETSSERASKFSKKKEVYWFADSSIIEEDDEFIVVNKFEKKYRIEKKILKPYFKPTKKSEKGMTTYSRLHTNKRIIFPYDLDGKLISDEQMKTEYPCCYQYLLDCYDRLVPKILNNGVGRDVPDADEHTWYKYGRTQALTAFINTPKLIVRVLSKIPMYAYDFDDMIIASGGTAGYCAIAELAEDGYALEFIQAWLEHPNTEKYFEMLGSDFENDFIARGTYLLKKLPILEIDFNNKIQKKMYNLVVMNTRRIYEINARLDNVEDKRTKSILEKEKNELVISIEKLISRFYQQDFRC